MKIHANDPEREIVQTFPNGMRDREHFAKWRTFNCQKCVIGNTQIPDPGTIRPGLGYRIPDTPRQARRKPVGAFLSARLSYTSPRRPTRRRAAIPDQRQGFPLPDPASGVTVEKFHYTGTSARNFALPDVNHRTRSFSPLKVAA